MSTTLIAKVKNALTGSEKSATELQAALARITELEGVNATLITERDAAVAQIATVSNANAALQQQVTALTANQTEFDQKVALAVSDRLAKNGIKAEELPAPAASTDIKSEQDYIDAISAEKDPRKKGQLYKQYAEKFLNKKEAR